MGIKRIAAIALLASVAALGTTSVASSAPVICSSSNQHQCWANLSGPNYSQVAIGKTPAGTGVACAVVASGTKWGGVLHCFSPVGTSGAAITGRGGEEAQGPGGWFVGSDPNKRIKSLTIEAGPISNQIVVHALRSDGIVFSASSIWPLGADPRMYFAPQVQTPPAGLRTIAHAPGVGLVGVNNNNQLFVLSGMQWVQQGGDWLFVAGNTVAGRNIALVGVNGFSLQVWNITGNSGPPSLPASLNGALADPFFAFDSGFGRATPLAIGPSDAWAVLPGNCPSGSRTPCIRRSTRGVFGGYSAWTAFPTADIGADQIDPLTGNIIPYPMPWTIQDGSVFRGVRGEIWVAGGRSHLKFWAP